MNASESSNGIVSSNVPPALLIAVEVAPVKITGHYDKGNQTWSNRNFEAASEKKHNEDM